MTRKDYVKFAEIIVRAKSLDPSRNEQREAGFQIAVDLIKEYMADIFYKDNPAFDYERFYEACEVKQ